MDDTYDIKVCLTPSDFLADNPNEFAKRVDTISDEIMDFLDTKEKDGAAVSAALSIVLGIIIGSCPDSQQLFHACGRQIASIAKQVSAQDYKSDTTESTH